jgi:cytochrome c oxidase cbb3-type subunit 3
VTRLAPLLCGLALLAACDREARRAADVVLPDPVGARRDGGPAAARDVANPYANDAWALAEGQQLFQWMNCVGCHAQGGGGMGPPLMDAPWRYGAEPAQVFASIVEGRPNGMPSYRDELTTQQVWQLVTYVRALSGQSRFDVPPSRTDHMHPKPAENLMPREVPVPEAAPAATAPRAAPGAAR